MKAEFLEVDLVCGACVLRLGSCQEIMGAGGIIRAHQYCTKVGLNTMAMMIKMVTMTMVELTMVMMIKMMTMPMVELTSPAHERSGGIIRAF